MGYFNVLCSVSKLPIIYNTPIIFIPLELGLRLRFESKLGQGQYAMHHICDYYKPLTLPIKGLYDNYGGIKNIEKNDNIDIIEKYFNTKIENIVHIIDKPEYVEGGMFIHRKIYDFMINRKMDMNNGDPLTRKILSEYFDIVQNNVKIMEEKFYKSIEICRVYGYQSKEMEKIREEICELKCYGNLFHFIINLGLKYRADQEYVSYKFQEMYCPAVMNGLLKEDLIDFKLFEFSMDDLHTHYGPSISPGQSMNFKEIIELDQKGIEVAQEYLKEINGV